MRNAVFLKIMEKVRKHRDINLATTKARRNDLVSQLNYRTTIFFSEKFLVIEMKENTNIHKYNWVKPKH